jgi:glycosyltransferase involved in cell wall biosynthesis
VNEGVEGLKIAFDSWVLSSRLRYQGTYVYAQNLVAEFRRIARTDAEISFCLFHSPRAANDANAIMPDHRFELSESRWLSHDRLWRLGGVNLAASRAQADVVFSPTSNLVPIGAVPVVCAIHDVTPVIMPSHSRKVTLLQRSMLWAACKYSRAIITGSQCSKRDLMRIYGVAESKIAVVPYGYDDAVFNDSTPDPERQASLQKRFDLVRPYLWHHGVIQPRKNLKRLIEAYRLMLSRNASLDCDLVLAGPLGWEYQEIAAAAAEGAGCRGRVILTGPLDDLDLACLLKGASVAVVPSLYEGFCLPMVEAMACGVASVVADASCLPEVSGRVLKYFDPHSLDDMASCIESVLESRDTRTTLAQRGKERSAVFSWRRCAEETLSVLKLRASA